MKESRSASWIRSQRCLLASDEAACLGDVHRDTLALIDPSGESRERPTHQVDQIWVELKRVDACCVMVQSTQHVGAPSRSQDERAWRLEEVVRERCGLLIEICERTLVARKAGNDGQRFGIREDTQLQWAAPTWR